MNDTPVEIEDEINDLSEEDLDRIDLLKRHNELIRMLKEILVAIKEDDDKKILESLDRNNQMAQVFLNKVNELSKPEISVNQDLVINELANLGSTMERNIAEMYNAIVNAKPKEWVFTVSRDYNGFIETVKAKQVK